MRLSDAEIKPTDRTYRHSRWHAVLLTVVFLGAAAWAFFHAYSSAWKPGYYMAGAILLMCELLRRFVTARFRSSNWLARTNDQGVFIQFRSYLNYHLRADDFTVVFISYQEIRLARLIKERVQVPSQEGGRETQYLKYVELELAGDVTVLSKALEAEAAENAPKETRWYGSSSTFYQDHPMRMLSAPFFRIRWQVTPGAKHFLEALRPYTAIADPVSISQDFAHLGGLSREEQQVRLRELAKRGETISAIYLARKLHGGSLAEAKDIVENLKEQSPL
jgi:hypothetical protein